MTQVSEQLPTSDIPSPSGRRWGPAVRLGVLVAVLVLIAWYVATHRQDFQAIQHLRWPVLAGAFVLSVFVYVYSAAAIVFTTHVFSVRLGLMEAMLLSLITRFGNILLPFRGGSIVRAVYLNKTHRLSYAHFLAGLSAMLLSTAVISLLCALGGLLYIYAATGKLFFRIIVLLFVALATISVMAFLRPRLQPGGGLRMHIHRLLDGYHDISRHRPSILGLLGVGVLHVLTMAAIYAILLRGMNRPGPWGLLVVIVALGNISTIFQITPGNVGVYEGLLAVLGSLMGLEAADILAASLVWRVLDTVLIVVSGPLSSYFLTGRALSCER